MRQNPKPQEIYRHFKGNIYQILTLARDSETGAKMIVYQQLYEPFEVYVRPLEMFMSRIDTKKYPNEKQTYRFEKLNIRGEEIEKKEKEPCGQEKVNTDNEFELDPGLVEFLDADSYEKKLQVLGALHHRITDSMIDTIAVSLDTEVHDGDIEARYSEIKSYLITMERFECNRLR